MKNVGRSDYKARKSGQIEAPGEKGDKGIPKGISTSKPSLKGQIEAPGEQGNKGAKLPTGVNAQKPKL